MLESFSKHSFIKNTCLEILVSWCFEFPSLVYVKQCQNNLSLFHPKFFSFFFICGFILAPLLAFLGRFFSKKTQPNGLCSQNRISQPSSTYLYPSLSSKYGLIFCLSTGFSNSNGLLIVKISDFSQELLFI